MPSSHLRFLRKRCGELRRHFLPNTYSPTGDYSDRQMDRVVAYRVLVHAEFEHYCEEAAWDAAQNRLRNLRDNGELSVLLYCMALANIMSWKPDEFDIDTAVLYRQGKAKSSLLEAIYLSVKNYRDLLDGNHGIREANIKKIFFPIGMNFKNISSDWVADLDDFGIDRGEVAHHSIGVARPIDPATEEKRVSDLLTGFGDVDKQIIELGGL